MSDRQLLLLQGPAHGKVVKVRGPGTAVTVEYPLPFQNPGSRSTVMAPVRGRAMYVACEFSHDRKTYQVGLCAEPGTHGLPKDAEVLRLIESTNFQPFEVFQ